MPYAESELIMLSALQHTLFCPRQCALIHLEQAWQENSLTAQGRGLHEKAHSETAENRPDCKRVFGMPVRSIMLGLTGQCDCVLETDEGKLIPLEYKRGRPKQKDMDTVQLCAQALCLEEMTGKTIEEGFIYYFRVRKRLKVIFDDALRNLTLQTVQRTRELLEKGVTPPPEYSKRCESCSLIELCLPKTMGKTKPVQKYMDRMLSKKVL